MYMYTNNYSNTAISDIVIAKINGAVRLPLSVQSDKVTVE